MAYRGATGKRLWVRRHDDPTGNDQAVALAAGPRGHAVYVTGFNARQTVMVLLAATWSTRPAPQEAARTVSPARSGPCADPSMMNNIAWIVAHIVILQGFVALTLRPEVPSTRASERERRRVLREAEAVPAPAEVDAIADGSER